jgi:heme exporter protein CcmD
VTGVIEAGTRWEYVIAAYAATLLIMGALVLASWLASRRARRDLERLEQMPGLRRRAPGEAKR